MIRTQIYIPENLYKQIQLMSEQNKISIAEGIRTLLKKGFSDYQPKSMGDELLKLSNIKGHGPSDLSSNVDKYLYEEE